MATVPPAYERNVLLGEIGIVCISVGSTPEI